MDLYLGLGCCKGNVLSIVLLVSLCAFCGMAWVSAFVHEDREITEFWLDVIRVGTMTTFVLCVIIAQRDPLHTRENEPHLWKIETAGQTKATKKWKLTAYHWQQYVIKEIQTGDFVILFSHPRDMPPQHSDTSSGTKWQCLSIVLGTYWSWSTSLLFFFLLVVCFLLLNLTNTK